MPAPKKSDIEIPVGKKTEVKKRVSAMKKSIRDAVRANFRGRFSDSSHKPISRNDLLENYRKEYPYTSKDRIVDSCAFKIAIKSGLVKKAGGGYVPTAKHAKKHFGENGYKKWMDHYATHIKRKKETSSKRSVENNTTGAAIQSSTTKTNVTSQPLTKSPIAEKVKKHGHSHRRKD